MCIFSFEKRMVQKDNIRQRFTCCPQPLIRSSFRSWGNIANRQLTPYRNQGSICAAVCNGQRGFHLIAFLRNRGKSWHLLQPSCRIGRRLWFSSSRWDRSQSPPYFCIAAFLSDSFAPLLPVIGKRLAALGTWLCGVLDFNTAVFAEPCLSFKGSTFDTFQDIDIVHS